MDSFEHLIREKEIILHMTLRAYQRHLIELRPQYAKETLEVYQLSRMVRYVMKKKEEDDGYIRKEKLFHWITISPHTDTKIAELKCRMERLVQRTTLIRGCKYVYEQSGKTAETMGYHPHIHMICDKVPGMSPKQMYDRISNTFKGLGNGKMVQVQQFPESFRDDKNEYLLGNKYNEGKDESCHFNAPWRVQNNIDKIYTV